MQVNRLNFFDGLPEACQKMIYECSCTRKTFGRSTQMIHINPTTVKCPICGTRRKVVNPQSYSRRQSAAYFNNAQPGGQPNMPPYSGSSSPRDARCRIWWTPELKLYQISAPFNRDLIEFLKRTIPAGRRHFDDQTKFWGFGEEYLKPVRLLVERLWPGGVKVETKEDATRQANTAARLAKKSPSDMSAEFLALLPFEAAQAAYKKAAILFHPDRGGDPSKMTQLNSLWDRIQKEVYKK